MRGNLRFLSIVLIIFLLIDLYVFQGVKYFFNGYSPAARRVVYILYWVLTVLTFSGLAFFFLGNPEKWTRSFRSLFFAGVFTLYLPKLLFLIFLLIDDIQRIFRWIGTKLYALFNPSVQDAASIDISRADFLLKTGVFFAAVPFVSMLYGILIGAHDYTVRKVKIKLKHLPASFNGLKILQISDIHCGSFYNKSAVERGVQTIMKQNADIIFFTGDLVNDKASEAEPFIELLSRIKAPMGVFSVLGNHDYGDYYPWESIEEKKENMKKMIAIHSKIGWKLLINENVIFKKSDGSLALIGIENWGKGARWPKYGKLEKAYKGVENADVKLLLSHDPSHWDAQVRPEYPDIDVMFSGHTHGFQFGVRVGNLKWSPVQYVYDQWAGLYKKGKQFLYVNRGFGYIGFPGRVGMPPEITVMELERG
ncbi:MAG: metallophosphoesterase [Cytophagaceae bacterium]